MTDWSREALQPDFEKNFGRPPTALELATATLRVATLAMADIEKQIEVSRHRMSVLELRLERQRRNVDRLRDDLDEAALDDLAAKAPALSQVASGLLKFRGRA